MNIDTSERGCLESVALEDHAVRDHNEEINLLNLKKLGLVVEILRLSNSEIALQRSDPLQGRPADVDLDLPDDRAGYRRRSDQRPKMLARLKRAPQNPACRQMLRASWIEL